MMKKLKITSKTQRVFALWVKTRYDIGVYRKGSLLKGEYEALQSIVDDGTYEPSAAQVLNSLRKNLAKEWKQNVKELRPRCSRN